MKATIFNGNEYFNNQIKKLEQEITNNNYHPKLGIIYIGNNSSSEIYVNHKIKTAKLVGIEIDLFKQEQVSQEEVENQIQLWNKDSTIHGILIQLPLTENLDKFKLFNLIDPNKDVDGFSPTNKGLMDNNLTNFIPATAKAVIAILDFYKIDLTSKEIILIGYSDLLGMPLFKYFLAKNATVKVVNEHSKNWILELNKYDIIISSVGKPNLFTENDVKKEAIIIGVGISKNKNNEINGDFEHNKFLEKCKIISPTPGGVGPLTVLFLLENTLIAFKKLLKIDN